MSEPELINLHKYLNTKWDVYKQPVFDIFTAAGQSNMAGRGGDANATVKPDYGREFDPQYWTPATKTPLKLIRDPVGATDTIDTGGTGSCLPAFCEEYYKQTGRECVILYCARGGSSIFSSTQWDLDYKDTNYVGKSVDILNQAVTKLTNMGYEIKTRVFYGTRVNLTKHRQPLHTRLNFYSCTTIGYRMGMIMYFIMKYRELAKTNL